MFAALGRLPNAPLAYVVAQVSFEPFLEIEKHIPALQSSLRVQYPRYQRTEQVAFQVLPRPKPQPPQLQPVSLTNWEFGSISNRTSVTIQQNSLMLQATEYETYEIFGQIWREIMQQVGEQIPNLLTNRIGLRYIDFILPSSGETPEDYIADRLRCDPEPGLSYQKPRGLTLVEYQLEHGMLMVRCWREIGRPALPPDLAASPVLEPSIITQRAVAPDQPTSVLDIDRSMPLSMTYDAGTLAEGFERLHKDVQVVFKALTTDHARTVWSGDPPA
ncbi:MAG: TIGR04255 family protein [Candidatus Competibacter denitrificans]|jgi:uncharacterized protein (TIGR04255 family)